MLVEARVGNERRALGTARDSPDKRSDMRAALRRVAEAVAAGLFSPRAEANWLLEMVFPSEQDWQEFADKPTCGGIEADPRQLEEALARPDGCIIVTDDNVAAVYVRLDAARRIRVT